MIKIKFFLTAMPLVTKLKFTYLFFVFPVFLVLINLLLVWHLIMNSWIGDKIWDKILEIKK